MMIQRRSVAAVVAVIAVVCVAGASAVAVNPSYQGTVSMKIPKLDLMEGSVYSDKDKGLQSFNFHNMGVRIQLDYTNNLQRIVTPMGECQATQLTKHANIDWFEWTSKAKHDGQDAELGCDRYVQVLANTTLTACVAADGTPKMANLHHPQEEDPELKQGMTMTWSEYAPGAPAAPFFLPGECDPEQELLKQVNYFLIVWHMWITAIGEAAKV